MLGGAALLLLLLPFGCSMLPEFRPAIDTAEMREGGISSRFVDTPAGRLHVAVAGEAGSGGQVLFIHGSPGTWEAWRGFLSDPRLREKARLLAPDRLGFGGSARGEAEPSLAKQAASMAAVLEGVLEDDSSADESSRGDARSARAVVVGHSLGGPIAVKLAMDRPDLVGALLLVAPSIDPALEERRWYNVAGSLRVVQWFLPVDWIASNRELWPLKEELEAMLPAWGALEVPVVVVQGGKDNLVPAANADFAARVLEGRADIRRHPDDGHFLLWQKPETVTGPLLELLARQLREGESAS